METTKRRRIGLIYDERMCKHSDPIDEYHPEKPDRIRAIWNKLHSTGITHRCVVMDGKEAEDKDIALVHSKNHIDLIRNISSEKIGLRRNGIAAKFSSIYFNEGSSESAYLSAGSVIEVAEKVAEGELDSAFAIVRPPGHHAEENEPMGFCLYNNVAVATRYLLDERPDLGIKKILIVDWDVHHGNGTQKMFWKDPRVLFFSVHRHELGSFYPGGEGGSHVMTGEGPGAGYNINVPWENGGCGDADYLAVWDHILIPVAKEFDPNIILISAGFDAAIGDPLGGCRVSPYGYSVMLHKLLEFAGGKIVMALEGGYNLESIANSVQACIEVLLQQKPIVGSSEAYPFESTWRVIHAVREELSSFWQTLAERLPEKVTSMRTPYVQVISSESEDEYDTTPQRVLQDLNKDIENIIQPFSDLKVNDGTGIASQASTISHTWRAELSKIDIWYATFGSNMNLSRFLCYIAGGQVEGMQKPCIGSLDKSKPKEITWKTFPHRLFFARERTATWGPGGVAFLHPESNSDEKSYLCLYRITLEQFNDVLLQENVSSFDMNSPLFDMNGLQSIEDTKCISAEAVKNGWYHNVLYLGKENGIPILTMTCRLSDVENFKSGKVSMCKPCKEYANTLIRGLVEGKQLSEEEATAYIQEAANRPL
ncbi:histone deacetylase 5 isoform X1 [Lycium ferocissimum]|uniref:histone deacetylase 5 isoform X1 n=1 Tax=Lycium ferocissimum TaxID=112874 RepID=UPI0028152973|nr:histone deacetylase 5 isoform X1 [Lycium ferocissimum]